MGLFNKLFGKNELPIKSNKDFWVWFQQHEQVFHDVLKNREAIAVEKEFIDKVLPNLKQLNEGFYILAGMSNDGVAELIVTAEGVIKNIVFVEDFINASPKLANWKFTALKPAVGIKGFALKMTGYDVSDENLFFYENSQDDYLDEIDITLVHADLNTENEEVIKNASLIFLDNYLGELNFATMIDKFSFSNKAEAKKMLMPIDKLKDLLSKRQQQFIENQQGVRRDTDEDSYSSFEWETKDGKPGIAVINTTLLNWDSKASHPWVLNIVIKYDGEKTSGMPDNETFETLNQIEDSLLDELKDFEGYLNIGRETCDGEREINFACKEFRKPSKVLQQVINKSSNKISITYDIYKDRYWRSFNKYL
jgi:Family of unknown function (DUF695)